MLVTWTPNSNHVFIRSTQGFNLLREQEEFEYEIGLNIDLLVGSEKKDSNQNRHVPQILDDRSVATPPLC